MLFTFLKASTPEPSAVIRDYDVMVQIEKTKYMNLFDKNASLTEVDAEIVTLTERDFWVKDEDFIQSRVFVNITTRKDI